MTDDLLAHLRAARSIEERTLILTRDLLESVAPPLRAAAWAAAVPHWFDGDVLAALLDAPLEEAGRLYAELQTLPFVEPFRGRGHNVHELARRAMLADWWAARRGEYRALCARAAAHFSRQDEPAWQIEQVYHLLIADPEQGADGLRGLDAEWTNSFQHSLQYALAQAAVEHAENSRLEGRARGWAYYCLGDVERKYYHHAEAKRALLLALESVDGDQQLEANALLSLGEVHLRLAEYGAARERYEAALPLYRAIGTRLGEANALLSLGEVHLGEDEYDAALETYQEAAARYRALSLPNDEANAVTGMANVYHQRKQYDRAIQAYGRAIELAPGNAVWYRNRASEFIEVKDAASARADLERAAQLQPEHPYLRLRQGDLAFLEGDYQAAVAEYRAFVAVLPRHNDAYYGLGRACLALGDAAQARQFYEQALALTTDRRDVEEAIEDVEELLRQRPHLVGGDEILARLRAAT